MFSYGGLQQRTSLLPQLEYRSRYGRGIIYGCALFTFAVQLYLSLYHFSYHGFNDLLIVDPANSTLGFGGIYAVSGKRSPRQPSLLAAASLTKLEITIPTQPRWSEDDVQNLKARVNSTVDRGSAFAWLGHLNVLQVFLRSNTDSALIIEDDVDWDTRLRTQQIPQTAYAIRELVGSQHGYFGSATSWDIIWLGHCGDFFNASQASDIASMKAFIDPTMPKFENLHPWTQGFLKEIGASKNQQRLVHESVNPLCTFAYAITRSAAERVLHHLGKQEPVRDREHPCKAYDVRLLESCRDEGLKCISVNPELFHHSQVGSEIAKVSNMDQNELDGTANEQKMLRSRTNNIRCSARSYKWKELKGSIMDAFDDDAQNAIRELAETSNICYTDGM